MKYCKTCNVHYDTPIEHCLFCHGDLVNDETHEPTYKYMPVTKKKKPNLWLRFFVLLNMGSLIISLGLDYFDGMPLSWSFTVGAANLYAIALTIFGFSSSTWPTKLNRLMITTVAGLFLIGLSLRDYHWALDYVFPFVIIAQILTLSGVILFNPRKWLDVSANLLIMSILGLIPSVFFLLDINVVNWPTLACVSYSFITLLGIIFIPSKESREEFKSRFHI